MYNIYTVYIAGMITGTYMRNIIHTIKSKLIKMHLINYFTCLENITCIIIKSV